MSITVSRDCIITDSDTQETITLGMHSNCNIKLIVPSEVKPDIFEALFKEMKKLIDDL